MRPHIPAFADDSGQALVELACVLPLLLLLLFGIIDFGLAINQYNGETDLANLAARTVAVLGSATSVKCNGTSETTLTAYVDCEANTTGTPTPTGVCVADTAAGTPAGTNYQGGDPVEVKVTGSFQWMKLLTGGDGYVGKLNPSSSITASATMRLEQAPSGGSSTFLTPTCSS